jgi:DNA-binding protein HU-beta
MANKPLTKTQLIAAIADKMDGDKKTAGAALDALSEVITEEVSGGGAVTIPNVGKIMCRERPARTVRNPATGEQMQKEADRAVKMTFSKTLKDSVNG